jgi:predicted kinase
MEAVILIGVQGAGKSSFYRERFAATHVHISLDALRARPREAALIAECVADRKPFVIDNTNVLKNERARYIELAKRGGYQVAGYYFAPSLRAAIARNKKRGGQAVPIPGLIATFKRLEPPTFEEGFDSLYLVEASPENDFVVKPLDR